MPIYCAKIKLEIFKQGFKERTSITDFSFLCIKQKQKLIRLSTLDSIQSIDCVKKTFLCLLLRKSLLFNFSSIFLASRVVNHFVLKYIALFQWALITFRTACCDLWIMAWFSSRIIINNLWLFVWEKNFTKWCSGLVLFKGCELLY